jgi:hypothetical protein
MKIISYILFFLFFGTAAKAQDLIILRDGTEIKSLVAEVLESQIKYKKFDNKLGPTYSVAKNKVSMIRYENGTQDVFNENPKQVASPETTPNNVDVSDILVKPATKQQIESGENRNIKGTNHLAIVGKKVFKDDGTLLRNSEIQSILSIVPPALKTYKKGRGSMIASNIVIGAAAGITIEGLLLVSLNNSSSSSYGGTYGTTYSSYGASGTIFTVLGLGGILTGILMNSSGKHRMSEGINMYNNYLQKVSFNVSPIINQNGIGVCMKF